MQQQEKGQITAAEQGRNNIQAEKDPMNLYDRLLLVPSEIDPEEFSTKLEFIAFMLEEMESTYQMNLKLRATLHLLSEPRRTMFTRVADQAEFMHPYAMRMFWMIREQNVMIPVKVEVAPLKKCQGCQMDKPEKEYTHEEWKSQLSTCQKCVLMRFELRQEKKRSQEQPDVKCSLCFGTWKNKCYSATQLRMVAPKCVFCLKGLDEERKSEAILPLKGEWRQEHKYRLQKKVLRRLNDHIEYHYFDGETQSRSFEWRLRSPLFYSYLALESMENVQIKRFDRLGLGWRQIKGTQRVISELNNELKMARELRNWQWPREIRTQAALGTWKQSKNRECYQEMDKNVERGWNPFCSSECFHKVLWQMKERVKTLYKFVFRSYDMDFVRGLYPDSEVGMLGVRFKIWNRSVSKVAVSLGNADSNCLESMAYVSMFALNGIVRQNRIVEFFVQCNAQGRQANEVVLAVNALQMDLEIQVTVERCTERKIMSTLCSAECSVIKDPLPKKMPEYRPMIVQDGWSGSNPTRAVTLYVNDSEFKYQTHQVPTMPCRRCKQMFLAQQFSTTQRKKKDQACCRECALFELNASRKGFVTERPVMIEARNDEAYEPAIMCQQCGQIEIDMTLDADGFYYCSEHAF